MQVKNRLFYAGLFLYCLLVVSCAQDKRFALQPQQAKLANPASQKCIEDGYELRSNKSELGISSELFCFNRKNNKQYKGHI